MYQLAALPAYAAVLSRYWFVGRQHKSRACANVGRLSLCIDTNMSRDMFLPVASV